MDPLFDIVSGMLVTEKKELEEGGELEEQHTYGLSASINSEMRRLDQEERDPANGDNDFMAEIRAQRRL